MNDLTKEQAQEIAHLVRLFASASGAKRKSDSDADTRRSLCNRLYQAHAEGMLSKAQLVRLHEASAAIDYAEDFDLKFRDWLNTEIRKEFKLPKARRNQFAAA